MNMRYLMVAVAAFLVVGWKSAPPITTNLSTIMDDPAHFNKKRVEFTASVVKNPVPIGAEFKKWDFAIGSADKSFVAYERGFNPATIVKAHHLVEQARRDGREVILTGKVRIAKGSGAKLSVDSIRYGDKHIWTDVGPFVEDLYSEGMPWTPLWYDGIKYYPGEFPL